MLINQNISNLYGGVSRQPVENRYDNQVEEMVNCFPTVSSGLRRRNPINLFKSNIPITDNKVKLHSYNRGDGVESYIIAVSKNEILVYDLEGNQKTVDISTLDNPYLQSDYDSIDVRNDLEILTVGDTTWFLNKKKIVSTTGELTQRIATRDRGFNWIKRSFDNGQGQGYYYYMKINEATFEVNDTSSESVASGLANEINAYYSSVENSDNGYSFPDYIRATNIGSYVYVYVAEYYAPNFRLGTGYNENTFTTDSTNTNMYVRIKNEDGNISGVSVENPIVSFNLITGKWQLYASSSVQSLGFHYISELFSSSGDWLNVRYYLNANQAVSDTSSVEVYMPLYNTDGTEVFDMSTWDSFGDTASFSWKDNVPKISDLPSTMDSFTKEDIGTIAITGRTNDDFNNYYLTWEETSWKESVKEGIEYEIDNKTLPAKLVRQSDGSFVFGFIQESDLAEGFSDAIGKRVVGDDDTNPLPSFIGSTLSNMFFFKNRLCFTSNENVILSETGEYYNFFATTAMEILDNDAIDASVDSNGVAIINAVNVTSGGVTLWSEKSQFLLSGGEILSPSTTRISQTSSYENDVSLKPISIDNEIIFFNKKESYTDAFIYSPASLNTDTSTSSSISIHVPHYIPHGVNKIAYSSKYNVVFLAEEGSNQITCYRYIVYNQERIMSSWFKFDIPFEGFEIIELEYVDNMLYIVDSSHNIYHMDIEPKDVNDTDFIDSNGVDSSTYKSEVILSSFNVKTKQGSNVVREPFYAKNVKLSYDGKFDLDIINSERNSKKTIVSKHMGRKIFIGGNSNKVSIGFSSEYNTGFQLNTVSIEGLIKQRSRNISSI